MHVQTVQLLALLDSETMSCRLCELPTSTRVVWRPGHRTPTAASPPQLIAHLDCPSSRSRGRAPPARAPARRPHTR